MEGGGTEGAKEDVTAMAKDGGEGGEPKNQHSTQSKFAERRQHRLAPADGQSLLFDPPPFIHFQRSVVNNAYSAINWCNLQCVPVWF